MTEPLGVAGPDEAEPISPEAAQQPDLATELSAELSGLAERPVEEHPEVYEAIHRRLGETLSGINEV